MWILYARTPRCTAAVGAGSSTHTIDSRENDAMMHRTDSLVSLLAVTLITASASAGRMFDISTIIADGMFNNAPSVAVDDAGVVHVAYTAQFSTDSTTKEVWYTRRPPGQPWEFTQVTDNNVREEFPALELDADGNVHIATHTGVPGGNKVRYVNNVGNPDGSFNPIVDITGAGYVIAEIDIDSAGTVHFVFRTQNFQGLPEEVYYTTWSSSGGVGPLVNLSQSPGEFDWAPQIAVDPDDNVHIVWQRGDALGGPLKYINNESGSFQEVSTGVGSVLESFIVVDDNDTVSIIYRPGFDSLRYIESMAGGAFTPSQPVYTGTYRSAFIENVAVDTNGHRYVSFASNIDPNRGIFLSQETETGWLAPQFIDNSDLTNLQVSTAINDCGKLAVVYSLSDFDVNVLANLKIAEKTVDLGDCPADIAEDDNMVNVFDLLALLAGWGSDGPGSDLDKPNDMVNVFDLLALLAAWGPCE